MKKNHLFTLLLLFLVSMAGTLKAQQAAFPGAEGFGKYASGGRNGSVYHVSNLNDAGPGSFRDAVSQSNRIVVFDVGGVIHISSRIVIKKNITVAGQTAPGGGITLYGNGIALNGDSGNSIISHIRIRMGKNGDDGKDAIGISDGTNYIFNHVSVSWGRDGTFDINGSGIDKISIQDCIIAQGINNKNHSTGGLMQSGSFSIIRTLWIDNKTRNPKARGPHEFINSVIYNWGTNGYIMGDTEGVSECNLIGNYFICGPSGNEADYITRTTPTFYLYASDNWLDGNKDGMLNGFELSAENGDYKTATLKATPFAYPGLNTILSASEALNHIISNAGAAIARDEVDELLIKQLSSYGTLGQVINTEDDNGVTGAVGNVPGGTMPTDTDGDGMSDEWEEKNGLNKNSDDAMTISANGYANIENYIHSIFKVETIMKAPGNFSGTAISSSEIVLAWTNEAEDVYKLVLEYGTSATDFSDSLIRTGDATALAVRNLQSGTAYYFRITAVNTSEEKAFSDIITVQTPGSTSSESPAASTKNPSLLVYPNPVSSTMTIMLPAELPGKIMLRIYDQNGREVISRPVRVKSSRSTIDGLEVLTHGTYNCLLEGESGKFYFSILKQ